MWKVGALKKLAEIYTMSKKDLRLGMVLCAFNPNSQKQKQANLCKCYTNLLYVVSSRLFRNIQ